MTCERCGVYSGGQTRCDACATVERLTRDRDAWRLLVGDLRKQIERGAGHLKPYWDLLQWLNEHEAEVRREQGETRCD